MTTTQTIPGYDLLGRVEQAETERIVTRYGRVLANLHYLLDHPDPLVCEAASALQAEFTVLYDACLG